MINESRFPENLPKTWKKLLCEEKDKAYFKSLCLFLKKEFLKNKIFPDKKNILRALKEVDFDDVKVVILGQDPYHGDNQAIGRSFAVPNSLFPKPPSLINIFSEISNDLGINLDSKSSELSGWVKEGVLLLNTVLTVRRSQAFSHRNKGWEEFTDRVIYHLNNREKPVIFILWGASAIEKSKIITKDHDYLLKSPHPSPLSASRGFFGGKHFSKSNLILKKLGMKEIDWSLS